VPLTELGFFSGDDEGVIEGEGDEDDPSDGEGLAGTSDADRAKQAEEIKGVTTHGVRAGGDEGGALVAGNVERAPQPAHGGDGHEEDANEEEDIADEEDVFPTAGGE